LRRDGARVGDDVWVSGTLGDAAGALAQWQAGQAIDAGLRLRLDRPTPRVALGCALRGIATACIDVSDGLLADLGHACTASGVGARIEVDALPASESLQACFSPEQRRILQAAGGDDYELCFTAPADAREAVLQASAAVGVPVRRIGRVDAALGVTACAADGSAWSAPAAGWIHFA
jgi:thiamine-monophosphate kinase